MSEPDPLYLYRRYVSSSEAAWRLFGFEMQSCHPSVARLQVHLPDQQSVVYRDDEPLPAAMARGCVTTLTAWFKANHDYPDARDLLYADFPTAISSRTKSGSHADDPYLLLGACT